MGVIWSTLSIRNTIVFYNKLGLQNKNKRACSHQFHEYRTQDDYKLALQLKLVSQGAILYAPYFRLQLVVDTVDIARGLRVRLGIKKMSATRVNTHYSFYYCSSDFHNAISLQSWRFGNLLTFCPQLFAASDRIPYFLMNDTAPQTHLKVDCRRKNFLPNIIGLYYLLATWIWKYNTKGHHQYKWNNGSCDRECGKSVMYA